MLQARSWPLIFLVCMNSTEAKYVSLWRCYLMPLVESMSEVYVSTDLPRRKEILSLICCNCQGKMRSKEHTAHVWAESRSEFIYRPSMSRSMSLKIMNLSQYAFWISVEFPQTHSLQWIHQLNPCNHNNYASLSCCSSSYTSLEPMSV